jgi:nucleoside-diphosphate-sugar epimerase
MIYVENAARAHLLAADALGEGSPVAGQAYFLSQGEPVNCWAWINEILALAQLEPVRRAIPFRSAWYLGGVLEAIHWSFRIRSEPRMTRFLAAQLATSHYFAMDRAQRDFGYAPHVATEEGMERLGAWLREMR